MRGRSNRHDAVAPEHGEPGNRPPKNGSPITEWLGRRWWILVPLMGTILWLGVSVLAAWTLTRRPMPRHDEAAPPAAAGVCDSVRLETSDGESLGAWVFEGALDRPVVIVLHGNGATRRQSLPWIELLASEDLTVLAVTHRCHGDSTGEVNDFGRSAASDVLAAVAYAERQWPGRSIFVRGFSLGAAAAAFAAPELETRVSGYILEGLYRDLSTAMRHRTEKYLPPLLSDLAYWSLDLAGPFVLEDHASIRPIDALRARAPEVPLLLIAGERDRLAPTAEARELLEAAGSSAELLVVPGAGHDDLSETVVDLHAETVLAFLNADASSRHRRR